MHGIIMLQMMIMVSDAQVVTVKIYKDCGVNFPNSILCVCVCACYIYIYIYIYSKGASQWLK